MNGENFPWDAPARQFPHPYTTLPAPELDPQRNGGWHLVATAVDGDYCAVKATDECVLLRCADEQCLPAQTVTLALAVEHIDALMAKLARMRAAHLRMTEGATP